MSDLHQLTLVKDEQRDHQWEENFFHRLADSNISILSEEAQMGPDGWPYILAKTTGPSDSEPAQKVIQWAASRGIGLVINPEKDYPDYVFTYGMLWNFRKTGRFLSASTPLSTSLSQLSPLEIQSGGIWKGQPTTDYLPAEVRSILRDFFRDQSIIQPKILMISTDQKNYDLAFSLESLGNPPEKEHSGILEALSWFLPPHYALALVSEQAVQGFEPL